MTERETSEWQTLAETLNRERACASGRDTNP
jgi:hypothetical protein